MSPWHAAVDEIKQALQPIQNELDRQRKLSSILAIAVAALIFLALALGVWAGYSALHNKDAIKTNEAKTKTAQGTGNAILKFLRGDRGLPGVPGKNGKNGQPGQPGIGKKGSPGIIGITGRPGAAGASGKNGAKGAKGETGATGAEGQAGTNGQNAPRVTRDDLVAAITAYCSNHNCQGKPGTNGKDGKDGQNGTNGVDGQPGADGAPGIQGPPGATGPAPQSFTFSDGAFVYNCTDPENDGTYTCQTTPVTP